MPNDWNSWDGCFLKVFCDKDKELELFDDTYESPIPKPYRWENWAADDEGLTGDELLEFVDRKLFPSLRDLDLSTGTSEQLLYTKFSMVTIIT